MIITQTDILPICIAVAFIFFLLGWMLGHEVAENRYLGIIIRHVDRMTDKDNLLALCGKNGWTLHEVDGLFYLQCQFSGGYTQYPCRAVDDPNILPIKELYEIAVFKGRELFPNWAYDKA